MHLIEALVSGLIQGIAEFFPISSSGHLVFVHKLFGMSIPTIFYDICLHFATLIAVIIYFRKDIIEIFRQDALKWIGYLTIGSIPIIVTALFFEKQISVFFISPDKVAYMLFITGFILLLGQYRLDKNINTGSKALTYGSVLLIGAAQAFALLPGISRSGITITAGLLVGLSSVKAFRFSFLLMIPAVFGATVYKLCSIDIGREVISNITYYSIGMSTAFCAGILCLHLFWKILRAKSLYIFAVYCFLAGFLGLYLTH